MSDLKAPFPYMGGKSRVADLVWNRLGDPDNFVEPFAGTLAVLLTRPTPPKVETANDLDCYLSNFWRAIQADPEAVAYHADWPVVEVDLHARHRWLVLSESATAFRERMRTDPDYYDAKMAGWWVWGICCWIGSGWCQTPELANWEQKPVLEGGRGIDARFPKSKVRIAAHNKGSVGKGVHAKGKRPPGSVEEGTCLRHRVPRLSSHDGIAAIGTHGRPQLADAYSRGRGVHGNDNAGTCAQRRAWLTEWFQRLADRLRAVRICCGHWLRVCDSPSVTTRLGTTAVFLDPPYPTHASDGTLSRTTGLYSTDGSRSALDALRDEVLTYCLERGPDRQMRIAVCGYDTDGYQVLEQYGWECVTWRASGGYGNRSETGRANARRERIWFSPHCHRQASLFDILED